MHGYKNTPKMRLNFLANYLDYLIEHFLYRAIVNHENDHSITNSECHDVSGMDSKHGKWG